MTFLLALVATSFAAKAEPEVESWEPLAILGERVAPGTRRSLVLRSSESFAGNWVETPVIVVRGATPGPTLCLVAGVHGDEVNGVEVVRRIVHSERWTDKLRGTLIAVPIANISAFRRSSRYLPDRRDLNRYFPGRDEGSSASRIAFRLFDGVIRHCGLLIDMHTGSFHRTNLHQVRANLNHAATGRLARAYGAEVIVNNEGREGTLRRAAVDAGIPAITIEAGEPARFDERLVSLATLSISRLISDLGMSNAIELWPPRSNPISYLRTRWVRSDNGGILVSQIQLGDEVEKGATLGTVSDPISGQVQSIRAPFSGRVIGMALDQLVMPGFAAYHLASEALLLDDAPSLPEGREDPEGVDLEERPE